MRELKITDVRSVIFWKHGGDCLPVFDDPKPAACFVFERLKIIETVVLDGFLLEQSERRMDFPISELLQCVSGRNDGLTAIETETVTAIRMIKGDLLSSPSER